MLHVVVTNSPQALHAFTKASELLNLPTLKYRRLRRDMIDVFKITCMMHHLYLCCLLISHILQEEIVLS